MKPLALLASTLLLAGCCIDDFGSSERYSEDFHYSYPLRPDGRISVENFNGSIEISAWDQPSVDVSGSKFASSTAARDAIKIEVTPAPDSVSIRTVRPFEHRNTGARYVLKVPRKIELQRVVTTNGSIHVTGINGPARLKTTNGGLRVISLDGPLDGVTTNGSIELERIQGDCNVKTTNGRVRAEAVSGAFEASTSNSGVDARLDQLRPGGVRVATSNGGITLHLPEPLNGRLLARTSNGSVHTDFDVRVQGEMRKNHLEGTIGSGGPVLDLSTSNGSIRILRQ
jgi:hypothetical protein